jgi:hypothetical protein
MKATVSGLPGVWNFQIFISVFRLLLQTKAIKKWFPNASQALAALSYGEKFEAWAIFLCIFGGWPIGSR